MPNPTARPVIVTLSTPTPQEDVNLYTDLMAAAVHDEGATVRTGGHAYPVEVATVPHGAPTSVDETTPAGARSASRARGVALADVYRAALLDLGDTTATLASMVTDVLHLADAQGDSSAREVLAAARASHTADHTGLY